jgi:hypothetical protein
MLSRDVNKNSVGISASIAEKASDEAAVSPLFLLKDETESDDIVQIFLRRSKILILMMFMERNIPVQLIL